MARDIDKYLQMGGEGAEQGIRAVYAEQAAAQKAAQDKALQEYLLGSQAKQEQRDLEIAKQLRDQYGPESSIAVGKTHIGGVKKDSALEDFFKMEQFKALQEERKRREDERRRKATQDIEDRSTKAGTAQQVPGIARLESAAPGAFEGTAKFKSVGGLKNLVPTTLVPAAEWAGVMDRGAAEERAAIQELANLKIYDSSGKQINEAEMRRIQDALGLRGIADPKVLAAALKQYGYTVLAKQQQVGAGADQGDLEAFKSRGGFVGYKSVPELIEASKKFTGGSPQPGPQQQTQSKGGVSKAELGAYAEQHKMTPDAAKAYLSSQGYQVE